ncbi:MAG: MBL fold metallo-hydrolase [Deltaproteobacteria bacterium]|nr:MBL fold metallo-hydrolase [Deltaproteobacteria bacterium]
MRGSIAAPGPTTARYGGDTLCLELRCDDQHILIDMGSGARRLGRGLMDDVPRAGHEITILLSHLHTDHVIGFPFFGPLFDSRSRLTIIGDASRPVSTRDGLARLMSEPLFPVPLEEVPASLEFIDVAPGDSVNLGPVVVRTCALNHPGGAIGFRVEHRDRVLTHISDTEHVGDEPDPTLVAMCRDADVACYDAMFVEGVNYERHCGWGHSTWQAAVRLAEAAGVRRLVAVHHAPEHDDETLDRVARDMERAYPGALVAAEGLVIDVLSGELARSGG